MALLLVASAATVAFYLFRGQKRVQRLYVPKLLMLRIDEVSFPKGSKLPIDVMEGTRVTVACENVPPPADMGRAAYRFRVGGQTFASSTCTREFVIPGAPGTTQPVGIDYLLAQPDGKTRVIDHWEALVRPMPAGKYLRIRAFETSDARPLPNLTVPREVVPYVEAAVKLDADPESYAVVFFVNEFGKDLPVLQVAGRLRAKQKIEAVAAPLKRYRRFGSEIDGFAAWPGEPIQIGSAQDGRKLFEVYAVLVRKNDLSTVTGQFVGFEGVTDDGQARVKVYPKRLADIKTLAWRGWVSEPVRVVRVADGPIDQVIPAPKSD